ncbi:hypothetical protein PsAD2_01382 [Pseudovibrio axinellae]|uniref:Uncharacterized protein n=1 Tax=Pseudovibrio axinellae TaxID=989403 RepID=A0A166A1I7_9HYPH|nr:hypothetical protein [Pseudovibrio axinellae]KZL20527.1 hypothetical protein PsAD2_01382 [Pseudovibrio axinellae]SEQ91218.1 hypothetical protein SAMN05421798_10592 [Pseudovibrio axinellae]
MKMVISDTTSIKRPSLDYRVAHPHWNIITEKHSINIALSAAMIFGRKFGPVDAQPRTNFSRFAADTTET